MQACDRCRRRKSGCDKEQPSCGLCVKASVTCVYSDRSKEPPIRRDVIEKLERRLRQTEATNRALAARLAASKSQAVANASTTQNSQVQEHQNEVSDEVSFLSLNAGGERQFLGSTSGVLFADLIRSAIRADAPSTPGASEVGPTPVSELATKGSRNGPPGSSREAPPLVQENVARELHDAYFHHDHLCYPILSQDRAMASLSDIYADPTALENKPFETFCFYMVMAISTSNLQKLHWQSLPEAELYHTYATSRLSDIFALGGLQALQAILLLCQYQLTSSTQRTSTSLWHMVGMAARMCFEMGLHREEAYDYQLDSTSTPHRRWLWCVLAMDRYAIPVANERPLLTVISASSVVSITLGRPFAIQLEDVSLKLPTDALENGDSLDTEKHRDAVFAHITQYRILCGKIMSSLHRGRHTNNEVSALAAQASLADDLEEWRSKTDTIFAGEGSSNTGKFSSFLTVDWYEMIYHNALLMLYRPSPALPLSSSRATVAVPIIYTSAKQAIGYYAHLHELQRINYTWITLRSVFMAGLSFVYAVGQHFRTKKSPLTQLSHILESDPSIMEIVNICRSCSNVLVAVSERGNIPRHCHRVFDRLSDAVLKDAVDYHTSPVVNHPPPGSASVPLFNNNPTHGSATDYPIEMLPSGGWNFNYALPSSILAVDDVFRDCFDDLQHFHESAFGEDPIGQLSQDWLGQIGGVQLSDSST
ncbi:unnamed protein product [Penicillium salamii]|uniref:Zn(2)-C6 fungal-type domain-containing protein n=1 Tax=Penicillium salamii TaxID=1612424 RepID=A0A9W4IXB1_9EURO|nr:unnamed protein product [Penicillium salamii]CAG8178153.1 unnamed protein product [Penicillium salamii]CAG8262493.1 unnamed protein product [Penicillium salamii]CAG8362534.1 unnamed protein product [Penicillium salamii]CAG8366162.1 unnamed protein product [Penicillium salamii]